MVEAAARRGYRADRLPLGVDLGEWVPRPARTRDTRRPARLVHVASLSPVKDQTTLLRAAALLAAKGVMFTLDIVGEDTLAGRIQQAARTAGLEEHVRFHGFLEQTAVREVVREADLLVVSSRHEGAPIVLAEAAALGVPAVGTAVGQILEWAPDAAVAVPVADADSLAGAIETLLHDEATRLRIAANAQRRATAEDADWTAARVTQLYEEIAGA
jgi:glycosyltransferase involved in cell wall biosynthesis